MTKIDIFSGFLGAGKTTLIKKLITDAYKGEQLVLIENEFGEIGIDGGFLADAGIRINEMNSGCICCSLVGDFRKALAQVISEYHPDRILDRAFRRRQAVRRHPRRGGRSHRGRRTERLYHRGGCRQVQDVHENFGEFLQ